MGAGMRICGDGGGGELSVAGIGNERRGAAPYETIGDGGGERERAECRLMAARRVSVMTREEKRQES